MILPPDLRARLERLSLVTRRRVAAQWAGRHSSSHKGESLDFADYREYVPGDDFRRIDHNLWARLGILLVRQFEAEEELPLRVVIDTSRSMGFYDKFEVARTLGGMVTYMGLAAGDRVQLFSVPGSDGRPLGVGPVGRHLSQWPRLETWLERLEPTGVGALAPAIRRLGGEGPVRGSVVLVSDLLTGDWESALDGLAVGSGGVVLHVLGSEELEPDLAGDLRLADAESGSELAVSTSEDTMRRYREALERFALNASGRSRRSGLDYVLVPAVPEAPYQVLAALARAEAVS